MENVYIIFKEQWRLYYKKTHFRSCNHF